jgi:hypothetical protein
MSSFAFIGPNYFNSTTYNASSTAYNSEFPVYVDGTTATIPVNGSKYYGNVFGNVMCSFIVDGGDTILGGNLLLTQNLNIGGGINTLPVITTTSGNTTTTVAGLPTFISGTILSYLYGITSSVQTQISAITPTLLAASNTFTGINTLNNLITTGSSSFRNVVYMNSNKLYLETGNDYIVYDPTLNGIQMIGGSGVNIGLIGSPSIFAVKSTEVDVSGNLVVSGNLSVNGTTLSGTTLSYLNGVTSNVQLQINSIPSTVLAASNSFTGTNTFNNVNISGTTSIGSSTDVTTTNNSKICLNQNMLSFKSAGDSNHYIQYSNFSNVGTDGLQIAGFRHVNIGCSITPSIIGSSKTTMLNNISIVDDSVTINSPTTISNTLTVSNDSAFSGNLSIGNSTDVTTTNNSKICLNQNMLSFKSAGDSNHYIQYSNFSNVGTDGLQIAGFRHVNIGCSITPSIIGSSKTTMLNNISIVDDSVTINSPTTISNTLTVSNDSAFSGNLSIGNCLTLKGTTITGTTLSYLNGVTSSIQTQISAIYSSITSGSNTWTGQQTWSGVASSFTNLPTSSSTPTTSSQLTTKTYVDSACATSISNLKAATNTWSGTNSFGKTSMNGNLDLSGSLNLTPYASNGGLISAYGLSCNAVTCLGQIVAGGVGIVTAKLMCSNNGTGILGLQCGSYQATTNGTQTVTFPNVFLGTNAPLIFCQVVYSGVGYSPTSVFVASSSVSNFTYNFSFSGSFAHAEQSVLLNWQAYQI